MYSWRDKIRQFAHELEELGFIVTSSWLRERSDPTVDLGDMSDRFLREHADRDREDIRKSSALILFTVDPTEPTKRGGRHTEFGMILETEKLKVICGPKENIFHHCSDVHQFDNFEMVKGFLIGERERRKGRK